MTRFLILCLIALLCEPVLANHRLIANQGRKLCIFNKKGMLEWEMQIGGAPHDMHMLASGNLLTHQNNVVVEINLKQKKIVWEFDAAKLASKDNRVEVHSVAPLADGNIMVALSGEGKIFEIDREGNVQHSITLKRDNPHPHRDTRLVRPIAGGNYLVAQEGDGFVRQYDRQGKIVWEYDVPMFGKPAKPGHGPEAFGDAVFSALRLPNGNTLIGTGNGHSVLEVTPEKEIVWQLNQNDLPDITLAWVTTLEVHPNGNIIIGNCHAGEENPQLIEIDRDKNIIWQFKDFKHLGNAVSNSQTLGSASPVIR